MAVVEGAWGWQLTLVRCMGIIPLGLTDFPLSESTELSGFTQRVQPAVGCALPGLTPMGWPVNFHYRK